MTYKEQGFRAVYRQFIAMELTDELRKTLEHLPELETADCVLCYGYYDRERGITLLVIAAGNRNGDQYSFGEDNPEARHIIRINVVEDVPFEVLNNDDGGLSKRYSSKLEGMSEAYDPAEDVLETRKMAFLDECRDEYFIDDVQVHLVRDGLQTERCWTRIEGLGDGFFVGTLLNEPYQDFGYHVDDRIAFFVQKTEDEHVICISNMNPSRKLKAEDLEDGTMLKDAITSFMQDDSQENFIEVIELLRDSYVWAPCNAVLGEADQKQIEEMVKDMDDPESLIGKTFTSSDAVRLIPDILQNGDKFYFPVFSSIDEMGEYGDKFSKVQKHFLETISLARNNDKEIAGIVVNAFSEAFVLDRDLFDAVERLHSRLEETGSDSDDN